ncbi:MAG: ATP synthase F1 subunit epsilon [Myxococcales bacterium]
MPLSLEIVTPEERVVTLTCDEVRLTSVEGQFGIRPGHTPLVAALAAGELLYVAGGTTHRYAAGEGFAEVSNDRVRVLVEEAIRAEQLDPQRATQDLQERQKKLASMQPGDPAYEQERAQVVRAAARALVARRP